MSLGSLNLEFSSSPVTLYAKFQSIELVPFLYILKKKIDVAPQKSLTS